MPTTQLSDTEQNYLKSSYQNFEIFYAIFPEFHPTLVTRDPLNYKYHEQLVFGPIVRMGFDRIGFINQPLSFYGGDSYIRGGAAATGHTWNVSSGGTISGSGTNVTVTFSQAALYTIHLTVTDPTTGNTATGTRYIRIYNSLQDNQNTLMSVGKLSFSLQSGWSGSLTLVNTNGAVHSQQRIVVGYKSYYQATDGTKTQHNVYPGTGSNYDVTTIACGYVKQNSVKEDWQTHTTTFDFVGVESVLDRCAAFPVDFSSDPSYFWGVYIDGLTSADALVYMLSTASNYAAWHDVQVAQNSNKLLTITANEGSLLKIARDFMQNEFSNVYGGHEGTLYCVPDLNLRGQTWWGQQQPPVLTLDKSLYWDITLTEFNTQEVGYVQIDATTSTKESITVKCPPLPSTTGTREVRSGILCDDKTYLSGIAGNMLAQLNMRYRAQVTLGMCNALDANSVVYLTTSFKENPGLHITDGQFFVTDGSYQIDKNNQTWISSFSLDSRTTNFFPTANTSNNATSIYVPPAIISTPRKEGCAGVRTLAPTRIAFTDWDLWYDSVATYTAFGNSSNYTGSRYQFELHNHWGYYDDSHTYKIYATIPHDMGYVEYTPGGNTQHCTSWPSGDYSIAPTYLASDNTAANDLHLKHRNVGNPAPCKPASTTTSYNNEFKFDITPDYTQHFNSITVDFDYSSFDDPLYTDVSHTTNTVGSQALVHVAVNMFNIQNTDSSTSFSYQLRVTNDDTLTPTTNSYRGTWTHYSETIVFPTGYTVPGCTYIISVTVNTCIDLTPILSSFNANTVRYAECTTLDNLIFQLNA